MHNKQYHKKVLLSSFHLNGLPFGVGGGGGKWGTSNKTVVIRESEWPVLGYTAIRILW